MAITSSLGVFSNLNTDEIIGQLMSLERRPLQQLTVRKASYETKISAYGSLSSSLSKLKTSLSSLESDSIFSMSASSSKTSVLTATATTSATEGNYQIKVNNIATKQSLYSTIFPAETSEVADLSSVASQKISIQVGSGTAKEITIDSTNNTLTGVKNAINDADAGVTASVINDGTGYRLTITSNSLGASNRMTIKVDEDNDGTYEEAAETDATALSRLAFNATYDGSGNVTGGTTNMTQSQAAMNASMVVDGLTITRSSNTVTDLITGVTLNLLDDSSEETLTLSISKDLEKIKTNINSFVSSYNAVITIAKGLTDFKGGQGGLLTGDSTARGILTSLRSTITTTYANHIPASFGLSHDRNGLLTIDTSILEDAMETDLQGVLDTFEAMAESLGEVVTGQVNTLLPPRTDGLNDSVDQVEESINRFQTRLEKIELAYRRKFIALERTLSQLQQGNTVLTQRMDAISSLNQ